MKLVLISTILVISTLEKLGTCQDLKCNLTWTETANSNFRNAYKVSIQPTYQQCLDECRGIPGCLAVDIDWRNNNSFYYICWFHGDPKDLLVKFEFKGVNSFVKNVTCPAGIVPGLPGAETSWINTGSSGVKGPMGAIGVKGLPGQKGSQGPTGFVGAQGPPGLMGSYGSSGDTGPTGFTGSTGWTGSPGFPGVPGGTGSPGWPGSTGPGMFMKSPCEASWTLLYSVQSPNATLQGNTTRSSCQDRCLQQTSCLAIEHSFSTNYCAFHISRSNLLTKFSSIGFDQLVISSRCKIKGDSAFHGFLDLQGATGFTGFSGLPGDTGFTGTEGAKGLPGLGGVFGPPGPMGAYGSTGNTGAPGVVGQLGPTGLQGLMGPMGPTGDTGPKGNVISVDAKCQPTWVLVEDVTSPSSVSYPNVATVDLCMEACLASPLCLGVDFLVTQPPCYLVTDMGNLQDKIRTLGAIQLVLVNRCPNLPDIPVNGVGQQVPLTSEDESEISGYDAKDGAVGEEEEEGRGAWLPTCFLSLLSVLMTDAICYGTYVTWIRCRSTCYYN